MIPQAMFGRTGHSSSRTLFGAVALADVTPDEVDGAMDLIRRHGVNHIDTAANYGESETRLGEWFARNPGARQQFFLATKTGERTADKAWEEFRRSLRRLQVEQVDLLQFHELTNPDEWAVVFGPGGALEMAKQARAQGLTRFIGVTGHGWTAPIMHRRSLDQFEFDSVLLPCNYAMMGNARYAEDFGSLAALCRERQVAMQIIKSIARGPWGMKDQTRSTWYEPLEDPAAVDKAVHWILGQPGLFLNTVGDIHVLPLVLNAAERFQRQPSDAEMQAEVERMGIAPMFV